MGTGGDVLLLEVTLFFGDEGLGEFVDEGFAKREFQTGVGQARCAMQQTELAFLCPPGPKPKARFMNLRPQLAWASRVLTILRQPPPSVLQSVCEGRLKEKLGWIEAFAGDGLGDSAFISPVVPLRSCCRSCLMA